MVVLADKQRQRDWEPPQVPGQLERACILLGGVVGKLFLLAGCVLLLGSNMRRTLPLIYAEPLPTLLCAASSRFPARLAITGEWITQTMFPIPIYGEWPAHADDSLLEPKSLMCGTA